MDHVSFDIEPRFPIFGQWKTDWNQGYNMPAGMHLFQDKKSASEYTLEVDFMHAYDHSLTEDYTVKVILPEGATDIRVEMPSSCEISKSDVTMEKFFGTLDYFGRPTVVISKQNVVHDLCDQALTVKYTFNSSNIYIEIFCISGLLFGVYLAVILYSNLEMDLESKKKGEEKLKEN